MHLYYYSKQFRQSETPRLLDSICIYTPRTQTLWWVRRCCKCTCDTTYRLYSWSSERNSSHNV